VAANATSAAAVAEPAVQAACGALAAEALEKAGVRVDDDFLGAVSSCAGYAARRTCPVPALAQRAAPLLQRCDAALAAVEKAGNATAAAAAAAASGTALDAAQKAFCGGCYWPVLGLIMNEGELSDTYWCAARGVLLAQQEAADSSSGNTTTTNDASNSSSAALSPAEAAALSALYDPRVAPRFTSCLANVQGAAAARIAASHGGAGRGERDPLGAPAARAAAPRCWRRDALLRDAAGQSLAAPALRKRLQQLTCPGQPKGVRRCQLPARGVAGTSSHASSYLLHASFARHPPPLPDFKPFTAPGGVLPAASQAQNGGSGGAKKAPLLQK
jgi:hypothetical protein